MPAMFARTVFAVVGWGRPPDASGERRADDRRRRLFMREPDVDPGMYRESKRRVFALLDVRNTNTSTRLVEGGLML